MSISPADAGPAATPTLDAQFWKYMPVVRGLLQEPLATATTPVVSPTATLIGPGPINKGQTDFEELIIEQLAAGTVDAWTVNVRSSDSVTITVAPELTADIAFTVLKNDGQTIVNNHAQVSAREVETVHNLDVSSVAWIQIEVSADPASDIDYAIMVLDEVSYNFSFQGTLDFDSQRTGTLAEDTDHYWFFSATDGDTIDMRITPNGDADAYVELYGPDGSRLLTLDHNGGGEAEVLVNQIIYATGMYGIRVGEFDFDAMSYQIVVSKS